MGGGAAHSCWLLLALCMKGILAGDWAVHLPSGPVCAAIGSSVVLPCSYDYPQSPNETKDGGWLSAQVGGGEEGQQYKVLSEMWCLEDSRCITPSYVFHSAAIFKDKSYKNRVEYLGQPGAKNCSLRISDVRPTDSETYVFYLITSHPTQKMPEQSGVKLLVADRSSTVAVSASPSDITEGEALHLACCSLAAGPQTQVKWYKDTSMSPRHTGQEWDITNVTSLDSGNYYCQIQTGDTVHKSRMLSIDVEYSPRNTTVSVSAAGELPLTLTCSSDANPPVHIYSWYQDAACLPAADKSFHPVRQSLAAEGGPTLSSANITAEEYGQYCCVARNRHGSQTSSIMLKSPGAVSTHPATEETPSALKSKGRILLIALTIGVLLAVIVLVIFLIRRGRRSSRHQMYVLTETAATEP